MNNILTQIIQQKRIEITKLDSEKLRDEAYSSPTPRDVLTFLRRSDRTQSVRLIAELKKASPSKGILAPNLDLLEVADIYSANGAAAISVLTDEKYFNGNIKTLRELRYVKQSTLPLLRKDFIIDPSQVYETRVSGADAILLIVAALSSDIMLNSLHCLSLELSLTPLVEVHDEGELKRALKIPAVKLIGINNRNLNTFDVTLATSERLHAIIPPGIVTIAESGIFTREDVARLTDAGFDAILVGEALMTSKDIGKKVREFSSFQE